MPCVLRDEMQPKDKLPNTYHMSTRSTPSTQSVTLWYSYCLSLGAGHLQVCVCGQRKKRQRFLGGHHPLSGSLIILVFFLPNIEVSLSCYVSCTHCPVFSLHWFDVSNHLQLWRPHETQQALAVIGCWKKEGERGQEKRGDAKKERGSQGRSGDWISKMKPQSSSFPFQGLNVIVSLPLPNSLPPFTNSPWSLPVLLPYHTS